MSQESFEFDINQQIEGSDFIVSDANYSAFSYINKWPKWESNIFLIYGPKSCGKSYLAQIWQGMSGAKFLTAEQIYANQYNLSYHYILDDIEKIHDESALLHLFNAMKEKDEGYMLMTASNNPVNIGIRLADLRSRLGAVPSAGISDPDDEILRQMFVKQFADRQLKVDMDVIYYLISRVERSFESLYTLVDRLDKIALQEKKNITIPFARKVMEHIEARVE